MNFKSTPALMSSYPETLQSHWSDSAATCSRELQEEVMGNRLFKTFPSNHYYPLTPTKLYECMCTYGVFHARTLYVCVATALCVYVDV